MTAAVKLAEVIHGKTVNRVGKDVITASLTGVVLKHGIMKTQEKSNHVR